MQSKVHNRKLNDGKDLTVGPCTFHLYVCSMKLKLNFAAALCGNAFLDCSRVCLKCNKQKEANLFKQ